MSKEIYENLGQLHESLFQGAKEALKQVTENLFNLRTKVYLLNKGKLYTKKNRLKFLVEVSPEVLQNYSNLDFSNASNDEIIEIFIHSLEEIRIQQNAA